MNLANLNIIPHLLLNMLAASMGLFILFGSNYSLAQEETPSSFKPYIDSVSPDFTLKSFQGENIRLVEQRGQFVVLYFWASWSGASTRLLGQYDELYQKYQNKGLVMLSISIDPENVEKLLNKKPVSHPVLLDTDQNVAKIYRLENVPSVYLLDRSGKILMALEGFDPKYLDLVSNRITRLLEKNNE